MAVKTLTTRVQQKSDTSANWAKATNFTPLKGEIIVYTDLRKIKIGDGVTKVGVLEFVNAKDAETLLGASLSTILNSSDVEIPTSKAVLDALDGKVDKVDAGSTTQPVYFKDGVPTVINTLDSVAFDGYVTKGKKSGTTVGSNATAEGISTVASGRGSHAEGEGTSAMSALQHVEGKYNIEDHVTTYAHIVGNGTSDEVRSNAHTLDWSGNAWYSGKVSIGTTSNVPTPTADNDLVPKKYIDDMFGMSELSLRASDWTGTESPYSQVVEVSGVTANSKVDLNPTGEQLNSLATNRTILNTANDNGTVTVYAIGNKPTEDYTMQATITEV